MDKPSFDRASPEFAARRAEARKRLDALDPAMAGGSSLPGDPLRRAWFEAVYALAERDPARVPWANLAPHPLTQDWVAAHAKELAGVRVLDVGRGLGDNAECFAKAGAAVTAFDLVGAAIAWAKQRFPESKVPMCKAISSPCPMPGGKVSISSMNATPCSRSLPRFCRERLPPSDRCSRRAENFSSSRRHSGAVKCSGGHGSFDDRPERGNGANRQFLQHARKNISFVTPHIWLLMPSAGRSRQRLGGAVIFTSRAEKFSSMAGPNPAIALAQPGNIQTEARLFWGLRIPYPAPKSRIASPRSKILRSSRRASPRAPSSLRILLDDLARFVAR